MGRWVRGWWIGAAVAAVLAWIPVAGVEAGDPVVKTGGEKDAPAPMCEGEAELSASVPALEAFHEVIYPLWHEAWPDKNTAMMKELLPEVREHVAAVEKAELPGILRDSREAWEAGVATLKETLAAYEKAAAADDAAALADAVERIHADYEGLVRTVRPVMKELHEVHVELYQIYHYHLPKKELEPLRSTGARMAEKTATLVAAAVPKRFAALEESLRPGFKALDQATGSMVKTLEGTDWDAIGKAVEAVHAQYVTVEHLFDARPAGSPGH